MFGREESLIKENYCIAYFFLYNEEKKGGAV
jgi:hypothetical protein